MKRSIFLLITMLLASITIAQTVTIGNQVWMSQNLDISNFRNGDPIPQVKTAEEWMKAGANKQPAWCYYENDSTTWSKCGKLYNWHAVNDPRGLAPIGWHIPSIDEWQILISKIGNNAAYKMKNKVGWPDYFDPFDIAMNHPKQGNGNNIIGFNTLYCGSRNGQNGFAGFNILMTWWSATEKSDKIDFLEWSYKPICVLTISDDNKTLFLQNEPDSGCSIRCLKD